MYTTNIPNKYANLFVRIILSMCTSFSWLYVLYKDLIIAWTFYSTVLFVLCGVIFGFALLLFIWNGSVPIKQKTDKIIEYTQDTLINMSGVVISQYSDDKYLGKLRDEVGSDIVVKIDGVVNAGDKFVITNISGGDILASLDK